MFVGYLLQTVCYWLLASARSLNDEQKPEIELVIKFSFYKFAMERIDKMPALEIKTTEL